MGELGWGRVALEGATGSPAEEGGFGRAISCLFRDPYESYRIPSQGECPYSRIYKIGQGVVGESLKFTPHAPQDWNCWAGCL